MKFIHRLFYYGIGLFFGIIILMFFLGGKRASCDYSPNARTLKNIRIKDRIYTPEAIQFFQANQIDTGSVSTILNKGKVNFGKSETENDPCNIYFVTGEVNARLIELQVENCDSTATIQRVEFTQ
ncbi:hypothetical protein BH23BAC2_BH23BAC2_24650 [soil metagenome]